MASPVEFRFFLRAFALADLAAGGAPIRIDGRMFAAPQLQYRYRMRVAPGPNGAEPELAWSDWFDVPIVREGAEPFDVGNVPVTAETVRQ